MTISAAQKLWRKNHPEVKRAERLRYYRQFQANNRNKGKRWRKEEDQKITAASRPSDSWMSQQLGRSVQAIQQKTVPSEFPSPVTCLRCSP
jgi:hypothetical protein